MKYLQGFIPISSFCTIASKAHFTIATSPQKTAVPKTYLVNKIENYMNLVSTSSATKMTFHSLKKSDLFSKI